MSTQQDDLSDPIPVLFSSDLSRSLAFYEGVLGFNVRQDKGRLHVRHFDAELTILLTDDPDLTSNVGVILRVDDVHDLVRRYNRNAPPNLNDTQPDTVFPMLFSLTDPDGNSIYFVDTQQKPSVH